MFFLLLRMQNLPLKARIPLKHEFVSVNKYIDPSFSLMYISLLILKFFYIFCIFLNLKVLKCFLNFNILIIFLLFNILDLLSNLILI